MLINGLAYCLQMEGYKVSEEISKLPPQVQERLLRLQQLQKTLQSVLVQKQQVEVELTEIEQALSELQKTADDAVIYKAIGTLLVKAEKAKITSDLNERKELLNTRAAVLGKQEERLRSQLKDLQAKLQQDFSQVSPVPS
jgi:prefoldin beta subunit